MATTARRTLSVVTVLMAPEMPLGLAAAIGRYLPERPWPGVARQEPRR